MTVSAGSAPVQVTCRDGVDRDDGSYAETKVTNALAAAHGPVLYVHVVLDRLSDPALERPATAEVTADLNGTVVRAKAASPTMHEAVDELDDKLRRRVTQLQDRERTQHRWIGVAAEHEWRHGDLPSQQADHFPRPVESREVVRRKTFASAPMSADEAAFEMDLLDHDFFLYRDGASGRPALVHRLAAGGFGVMGGGGTTSSAVELEPAPPTLTDAAARERLEADGEPFVFYLDPESGDGRVLYLRYDGHYGLITVAR